MYHAEITKSLSKNIHQTENFRNAMVAAVVI